MRFSAECPRGHYDEKPNNPIKAHVIRGKMPRKNTFHLIPACKTFSHAMQQNLEILVGRKEKAGRKFRRTALRGGVIEDNCPIFRYLFKSDICLLIRYGGSTIISA
jgi:hypothetical protein